MWEYRQTNELYHYGVPGMKWGEHKAEAKQAVKDARRNYRQVRRETRFQGWGLGVKAIEKAEKANSRRNDAYAKLEVAKAELAAARKKDPKAAARAELNAYTRSMSKTGLKGSVADQDSGYKSTKMYDVIASKKGKEYADKVQQKLERRATGMLIGSSIVLVGSTIAMAILENQH